MTRFLRWLVTYPIGKPITCSEAAKHGAAIRKDRWIALRNSKARQLCAEAGRPVPEIFR